MQITRSYSVRLNFNRVLFNTHKCSTIRQITCSVADLLVKEFVHGSTATVVLQPNSNENCVPVLKDHVGETIGTCDFSTLCLCDRQRGSPPSQCDINLCVVLQLLWVDLFPTTRHAIISSHHYIL